MTKPIMLIVDASVLTTTKEGDYVEQKWIRKRSLSSYILLWSIAKSNKII
jgi:hypothetical protein